MLPKLLDSGTKTTDTQKSLPESQKTGINDFNCPLDGINDLSRRELLGVSLR